MTHGAACGTKIKSVWYNYQVSSTHCTSLRTAMHLLSLTFILLQVVISDATILPDKPRKWMLLDEDKKGITVKGRINTYSSSTLNPPPHNTFT